MRLISIFVMTISLVACSSYKQEKKAVAQEAAQTNVKDAQGLGETINDLINNSKTLSEEQKKELTDILAANKAKADELAAESYQFRAVLIKELLSGTAKKTRVRILERDIARVEKLRLKNTFDTVKRISAIVEKHPELQTDFEEHMIRMESRGTTKR